MLQLLEVFELGQTQNILFSDDFVQLWNSKNYSFIDARQEWLRNLPDSNTFKDIMNVFDSLQVWIAQEEINEPGIRIVFFAYLAPNTVSNE